MNWIQKIGAKMLWPRIKKEVLKYVESEEYQKKYVEIINKKLDLPNLSEVAEAKLLNQIYDAGQEAVSEMIDKIEI